MYKIYKKIVNWLRGSAQNKIKITNEIKDIVIEFLIDSINEGQIKINMNMKLISLIDLPEMINMIFRIEEKLKISFTEGEIHSLYKDDVENLIRAVCAKKND
jgi:acyl carrier protein